ncbi:MAG: hypothetical protein Q9184_005003 [Pyrenodesmia sp. 2 TL-2023]
MPGEQAKTLSVSAHRAKHDDESFLFVKRPGYCDAGEPITLYANFFELKVGARGDIILTRYTVTITREASNIDRPDLSLGSASRELKRQCIRLALQEARFNGYREGIISDHQATLYSADPLPDHLLTTTIQYHTEHASGAIPSAKSYTVRLERVKTLDLASFGRSIESEDPVSGQTNGDDIVTALNIFLGDFAQRQPLSMTHAKDKSYNFVDESAQKELGGGLVAIQGFFSSVRLASGRLLVNVNTSNAPFYKRLRLDRLMDAWNQASTDPKKFDAAKAEALQEFLKGLRIQALHLTKKDNEGKLQPWITRISGLAPMTDGQTNEKVEGSGRSSSEEVVNRPRVGANPSQVEFYHKGSSKYVSVLKYFQAEYPTFSQKMELSQSKWCVVNVGNQTQPIYLPAEACGVLPGQICKQQQLSAVQTQNRTSAAVLPPQVNKNTIEQKGLSCVGLDVASNQKLSSFGLTVPDPFLVEIEGWKLQLPIVKYANNRKPTPNKQFTTKWIVRGVKWVTPVPIPRFICVRLLDPGTTDRHQINQETAKVASTFRDKLREHGMVLSPNKSTNTIHHLVEFDHRHSVGGPFGTWLRRFIQTESKGSESLPFLLVILPDDNAARHDRLEEYCDRFYGVKSVFTLAHVVKDCRPEVLSGLCLKANMKLGGVNHVLPKGSLDFIERNDTMVVGIDVTHPKITSAMGAPSVVAMVACTDGRLAQWPAELRIQRGYSRQGAGIEMATLNLKGMLLAHVERWKKNHAGKLPKNILVFRDGIGEQQFEESFTEELPQLQAAFHNLPVGQRPNITLIICAKRHNVRLFKPTQNNRMQVENPPPGTYVDAHITESRPWNFYILVHEAVKGTARPAHYIVLHDEIIRREAADRASPVSPVNLPVELTHHMCYLFGRSTTAVSICPAIFYAHLACERARCYMQDVYDNRITASLAELASEESLMKWQGGLQARLHLQDRVKESMYYI